MRKTGRRRQETEKGGKDYKMRREDVAGSTSPLTKGNRGRERESIQSVGSLKALYTSPPGRPVHSSTNSTSLGSILAMQQLCAKTIHSQFHSCHVTIYTAE